LTRDSSGKASNLHQVFAQRDGLAAGLFHARVAGEDFQGWAKAGEDGIRALQGEYRDWARRQRRARESTCPAFKEKMSRRSDLVIRFVTGEVSRL